MLAFNRIDISKLHYQPVNRKYRKRREHQIYTFQVNAAYLQSVYTYKNIYFNIHKSIFRIAKTTTRTLNLDLFFPLCTNWVESETMSYGGGQRMEEQKGEGKARKLRKKAISFVLNNNWICKNHNHHQYIQSKWKLIACTFFLNFSYLFIFMHCRFFVHREVFHQTSCTGKQSSRKEKAN